MPGVRNDPRRPVEHVVPVTAHQLGRPPRCREPARDLWAEGDDFATGHCLLELRRNLMTSVEAAWHPAQTRAHQDCFHAARLALRWAGAVVGLRSGYVPDRARDQLWRRAGPSMFRRRPDWRVTAAVPSAGTSIGSRRPVPGGVRIGMPPAGIRWPSASTKGKWLRGAELSSSVPTSSRSCTSMDPPRPVSSRRTQISASANRRRSERTWRYLFLLGRGYRAPGAACPRATMISSVSRASRRRDRASTACDSLIGRSPRPRATATWPHPCAVGPGRRSIG